MGLARRGYRLYGPLQPVVLTLNRVPPLLALYRALYGAALALGLRYVTGRRVDSIYLRGSMASGRFVAGMSDVDLQFVIAEMSPPEERNFQHRFWSRFRRLRRRPIFGDASSATRRPSGEIAASTTVRRRATS